jgi:hypothetical protein
LQDKQFYTGKINAKKIKLPDAIILAAAKCISAVLLSDDWDDFQGVDPDAVIRHAVQMKP